MEIPIRKAVIDDAPRLAKLLQGMGWFEAFSRQEFKDSVRRVESRLRQCLADDSHPSTSPNRRMARSLAVARCTGCRIFSWRGQRVMFRNCSFGMTRADKV